MKTKKKKGGLNKRIQFLPVIFAASALTLSSCDKEDAMNEPAPSPELSTDNQASQPGTVEGKYLVVLKDQGGDTDPDASAVGSAIRQGSASKVLRSFKAMKVLNAELTPEHLEKLKQDPNVAEVEKDQPIQAYQTTSTTTTTTSTTQVVSWGATRIGMGSGVGKTAWVIDSGVQLNHPDLTVDATRSKSFISSSTSPSDQFGHGTMVAGIIAAKDNGYGVRGVAAGATIVSLRVMDATGAGSVSNVVAALNHVALYAKPGDVVTLSLGSGPSSVLDNAVKTVAAKGIFVCIAAGNSSANVVNYSPARVNAPNVYTVSGFKQGDIFMGISNWGSPTVDYAAPGTGLQTTKMNSLYGSAGGTSMAAPHIAGLLLLKGASLNTGGSVSADPDGMPDKIAHL